MHLPGVIAQNNYINQDNPQIITVSVGGNDVDFTNIVEKCVIPFNRATSFSQNCYQTYEDSLELVREINDQFDSLRKTYSDLLGHDPTRRVYVIGYPQLVSATGSCGDNVRLSQSDRQFATKLVDYLDSVISRAAAKAGVYYVDTQHAFDGHKLCESGTKAVNGLTAGNDNYHLIGNESYHPNKLGHELFARTILSQTNNLTAPMPIAQDINQPGEEDQEAAAMLDATKINRIVYETLNAANDIHYVVKGPVDISIDQFKSIVRFDSSMVAVLHSDPTDVGLVHVDNSGLISGTISIPSNISAGIHTLHLYGQNMVGEPIDVQQTVYVKASADDYDGDGIANDNDSCLGIPNSGHDIDQDSIDDACDPDIGSPPATSTPSGSTAETNSSYKGSNSAGIQVAQTTQLQQTLAVTNYATTSYVSQNTGESTGEVKAAETGQPVAIDNTAQQTRDKQSQDDTASGSIWLTLGYILLGFIIFVAVVLFARRQRAD